MRNHIIWDFELMLNGDLPDLKLSVKGRIRHYAVADSVINPTAITDDFEGPFVYRWNRSSCLFSLPSLCFTPVRTSASHIPPQ